MISGDRKWMDEWIRPFIFPFDKSLLCPFPQFPKQLLAFIVFILTSTLPVTSLPADTAGKGRRKVVHVLGKN